ncbi:Poly(3-hydroxyalkanoate) polymerase, subunit PhaC [Desulfonema limicola]|uniref:Poly(3-hydroxyalkanoate) polymerase subunit PhaC n=1 Tax=Desulfonema limicola TaxID=45656 RepID=A0A975GH16_9BACT|nr:class III poly(R)-hydroxyalkanoic acid synthase subunit PhaC [Desulfonema limicola]QTA80951.1 Poly(3-hydroxyalkanoate) polymerase, subunit PhaC [Desulfonema limicola]
MNKPKIAVDLILNKIAESTEKVKVRAQKASEVLLSSLETDLAVTPHEIVYQEDRVSLKYYKPEKVKHKFPLLLVYALINRETMLDLQPGRSVVETFLKNGIEVYMVDWGYPTRKDQFVTIDDHVNGYMDNIVDFIRKKHDIPHVNLMGICMGGAFSVMYSALHPEKIKNLVTTVTPTNFDTDTGLLHIWMKNTQAFMMGESYGNMPGDLMNLGFLLLNPARLIIDKYVGFFENIDNKDFVENFVRMEKWIFDSPDIPAATFKQFIEDCYQKNLLIQSKMELGGKRVDLKNITMPLLNFYGKFDHLVPPEACELLTKHVGSKDTEDICLNTGHIGIYVSSKCQELFAPKVAAWLKERESDEKKAKPDPAKKKVLGKKKANINKTSGLVKNTLSKSSSNKKISAKTVK